MVTVRIENAYSDGHESTHDVVVEAPDGDLDDWFDRVVYPHTGDGHGARYSSLGSCYTATIVAADNAALVGAECEWSG